MLRNGWKGYQRDRRVGVGEVHYKRVECKPARVAQGSYRAENKISGGGKDKMAVSLMYHKGSNHRDRNNPGNCVVKSTSVSLARSK